MKYKVDTKTFKELEGNIKVPKYQRRLVWSETEKLNFINSLKKGFPFGSILIYQYEDDKHYSLIDGLQRYTTMKDFSDNPEKYFDFNTYVDELIELIPNLTAASEKVFRSKITDILKELTNLINKNSEKLSPHHLYSRLVEEIPQIDKSNVDIMLKIIDIQNNIYNQLLKELNIQEIKIPCVQFTGDESELAEVFQNLNTGGKKLTKYQVFAAQWSHYEIQLNDKKYNNLLLEKVINRYENLSENRNVEIEDFNKEEMLEKRKINLSEFCYALGSVIIDSLPVFWSKETDNEDLANEIGYSVVGIILNVENNKLHKIIDKKEYLNDSELIESLVHWIEQIFLDINNYFKKYFKRPGIKEEYESKLATNFQILSYFASLWIIKHSIDFEKKQVNINERYKPKYEKALQNFIKYYIRDIVTQRWAGTGDKKLNELYIDKQNRYLIDIEKEKLETSLIEWLEEDLNKASIRFNHISKILATILFSFDQNKFTFHSYDYEHIYPRKRISKWYKQLTIPGGNLGNLMFLNGSTNKSKRELTFYENKIEGMDLDKSFMELVDYPSQNEMQEAINDLEAGNAEKIVKSIGNRAKSLLTRLVNRIYS